MMPTKEIEAYKSPTDKKICISSYCRSHVNELGPSIIFAWVGGVALGQLIENEEQRTSV